MVQNSLAISALQRFTIVICCVWFFFWSLSPTIVWLSSRGEERHGQLDPATVKGSPNRSLIMVSGQTLALELWPNVGGEDSIAAIYAANFAAHSKPCSPWQPNSVLRSCGGGSTQPDGPTPNVDNLISRSGQIIKDRWFLLPVTATRYRDYQASFRQTIGHWRRRIRQSLRGYHPATVGKTKSRTSKIRRTYVRNGS